MAEQSCTIDPTRQQLAPLAEWPADTPVVMINLHVHRARALTRAELIATQPGTLDAAGLGRGEGSEG